MHYNSLLFTLGKELNTIFTSHFGNNDIKTVIFAETQTWAMITNRDHILYCRTLCHQNKEHFLKDLT